MKIELIVLLYLIWTLVVQTMMYFLVGIKLPFLKNKYNDCKTPIYKLRRHYEYTDRYGVFKYELCWNKEYDKNYK